ncbi:3-(3-hydroxy-phenyl)propionate/3-hydroxycinnamic acid hydroxylase [Zhongshania aliphaticivorans]|uniref:3-(3-hydroxy-phenyl)propionate/3-hydroxycinnamic acid hydroxylase n=1 Tax=Zhongshania aliphaticivorans TaxID=1470434 RepID=A0A5S9Q216_9GAMM|nr:FAD-dependent monooxygenase [Zhongshania aliphaticivorans]CAA0093098.1 3-(3-hydroxy-phenyl)propionate/3-hydroxycinnamic acid hydroxylase [Zhongshania aliphaticivorans]CAA0110872.1 3-(3-hydroxy-phenyl)propionate/3-hydroxycinnamic acid hydroxylase [Zhongshania aliphaticivorans]
MTVENKYDVLIVGCGPSGAILANLLNAKGHKVAIFDRDKDIFHAPRAMMMDMESCRIVNGMGLYHRLMEKDAVPFHHHRFVSGKKKMLMEISSLGDPEQGYEPVMFHQPALEAMLREEFKKGPGVDAFLGYEVLSVDGEGQHASLQAKNLDTGEEQSFSAQYLVGADGGASTCRKYLNANRVDLNYSRDWIVMDLIIHDRDWWNAFREGSAFTCEPNAAVVVVKGRHGHIRMDFEQPSVEAALAFSEDDAHKLIAEYIDVDPRHIEIIRRQPYKFYAGMPDQWRKGRVFLAGDAAHQTSPFAGQGLNMGIRDAASLSIKLDMVLNGLVNESFLDTYQDERWENCAHMINGATKRGLMLSTSSKREILARNLSFMIGRLSNKLAYLLTTRMSDIEPYKDGLIGKTHPLAGARFFPPVLTNSAGNTVLIDEIVKERFTLISRQALNGDAVEWLQSTLGGVTLIIGTDIEDSSGVLTKYLNDNKADVLLLRPDYYIFDAGSDANDICNALRSSLMAYGLNSSAAMKDVAQTKTAIGQN